MAGDWIKIHRKIFKSAVAQDPDMFRLWVYCLCRANWQDTVVLLGGASQPVPVKRGAFITGRDSLHAELYPKRNSKNFRGPCQSTVWKTLEVLQQLGQITIKPNNRFSMVTICNYDTYQNDNSEFQQQPNNNLTTDQQQPNNNLTTDQQRANTEEELQEGKDIQEGEEPKEKPLSRKVTYSPEFETWWSTYPRPIGKRKSAASYATAVKGISLARSIPAPEAAAWLLAVTKTFAASPAGKAGEYCPHSMTWLNQGRYDDDPKTWEIQNGNGRTETSGRGASKTVRSGLGPVFGRTAPAPRNFTPAASPVGSKGGAVHPAEPPAHPA